MPGGDGGGRIGGGARPTPPALTLSRGRASGVPVRVQTRTALPATSGIASLCLMGLRCRMVGNREHT